MAMTEKVFDSAMSSFTVDVLVFNVQIEMFMHIAWRFECSLAGSCDLAMQVRSSSYRIFTDGFSDYIGFVAHVAMIPLVLIMWAIEASKFDFRRCGSRYLSKWGSLLDLLSITLCTVSLVFFWTMWFQSPWTGFDFAELFDPATQEQAYNVIVDQCSRSEEFRFLAAVNVLVVFLRMVGVVAALGTNLGLFLKVLEASCANMVAFSVMFLLVVIGMVFFIFFIFGSRAYQASSLARALYFLLSGLVGSPVYSALVDVDTMMADIFYPVYTVFYLTMLNVFISVLMSGYDVEVDKFDKQLKAGGIGNESLMSQFKREVHDNLWKPVQPCFSCVWSCIGPCVKEFACCNPQDLLKWCWNAPARPPSIDESVRSVSGVSSFLEPSGTVSHATSNFGTVSHDTSATDLRLGSSMRASGQVDVAECVLVSTLMAAFLSFLQLQSRNMSSFEATQVTMMSLETELHWEADGPYRIENYSTVFTMEGVGRWGHAACGALYEPASEQTCSVETEGEYQWDLRGRSCDSSEGNQQVVQRIGNWNIGFLSNTFVRMTVQPACYIKNAELLLNVGDTPVRATPNIECANEDCQRVLTEESCRTAWGTDLSKEGVSKFDLADESVKYADSDTELGSHGLLGGFVFNLGTNQRECEDMIATASDQKWFTKNAASIVFDWVTYNGNLDTFSFHTAAFSLMETGVLKKSLNAVTFNMNYTDGGGPFRTARLAILVLFALYALLVLVASLLLLRDLVRTVRRRVHDPSGRVAWWKIWFSNIWNLTDTISLALSLVNIIHIAFYLRIEFVRKYVFSLNELEKYAVPAEYEQEFQLANASDPARPLQDDYYYPRCRTSMNSRG
ncbi:unnamed protein product [Prorocentrum cordatum]|uniref:Polycystin cation channel PKD1/PKD2 domain-containing protein n=1 Tax=Prorocentrum cordatum TaxID=2364126 RepID=A0ABN9UMR4_9DINO|nr:unnamed protein product [Polarella glacialis]